MLTFSIVTVSLNSESTVRACLKSVIGQTYPHIEHIVIDGGSTDSTLDILQEYRHSIAHLTSEPDDGIYSAMNKGICAATGEVVFFLNSDDRFADNEVLDDVARNFSSNTSLEFLYGNIIWDLDGRLVAHKQPEMITREFLARKTIIHQTIFAKRSLFQKTGLFSEELRIVADYEWILKVFLAMSPVYEYLDRDICVMATSGASWSTSWEPERRLVMRKYYSTFEILRNRALPMLWRRVRGSLRETLRR